MVRGTLMLPNGTGKTRRSRSSRSGGECPGGEEPGRHRGLRRLAARIRDEGFMDFDVAVATPDQMSVVGASGSDPRPARANANPKSGTVHADVGRAVGT